MDSRKYSLEKIKNCINNFQKLDKYYYCINKYWYDQYYKNLSTKMIILCPIHGIVIQKIGSAVAGKGCRYCAKNAKLTFEDLKNRLTTKYTYPDFSKIWFDNNYSSTQKTKLKIICPIHGEFLQTVFAHINGSGCPKCSESKGERKVREFLESKNIKYSQEVKLFDNYRFDFYLEDLNTVIEYDGRQHYESDSYFGGLEGFLKTQERDKIKTEYCIKNDIRIIRIGYFEDIEEVLNKEAYFKV